MGYASHIAVQAFDEAKTVNTRSVPTRDAVPRVSLTPRSSSLSFALALYYLQLAMNCLWSPLYFGAKKVKDLCHWFRR
jgi:benzodiazapine receptor